MAVAVGDGPSVGVVVVVGVLDGVGVGPAVGVEVMVGVLLGVGDGPGEGVEVLVAVLLGVGGARGRGPTVEGDVGVLPEAGEQDRIENGACSPMEADADG